MNNLDKLTEFIIEVINNQNKVNNANVYCGDYPDELIITFANKTKQSYNHYAKVVSKTIQLGGIIKTTDISTYRLVVKFPYMFNKQFT